MEQHKIDPKPSIQEIVIKNPQSHPRIECRRYKNFVFYVMGENTSLLSYI